MSNKILVLGYFGLISNQLDGQTVKTRELYQLLENERDYKLTYFDTEIFKTKPLKIFHLIFLLVRYSKIVYLPAHNNLKYIYPIIHLISLIRKTKIYYFVIGGWLPSFLKDKKYHKQILKRCKSILVETKRMKMELEDEFGFTNVTIFNNFRQKKYDFKSKRKRKLGDPLNLVFMSRINEGKGIEHIKELSKYIEENELNISIDFFGPIDVQIENDFNEYVSDFTFVEYLGILSPELIVKELSEYDVLILPTNYYTEGLPGAIIDAYFANLPVIVSNWIHATEFVIEGKTGLIFEFKNTQAFIDKVIEVYNMKELDSENIILHIENEKEKYTYETALKALNIILTGVN